MGRRMGALGLILCLLLCACAPSPSPNAAAAAAQGLASALPTQAESLRALRARELLALEKAYLIEHPVEGKDLDEQLRLLTIDPNKPMVALTFDDGPSRKCTTRILDVLEKYGGRATFFVVGDRIEDHIALIDRAISLNCEIGNHTFEHEDYTERSESQLVLSLSKTDALMRSTFGYVMRLYRPTYGGVSAHVYKGAASYGYPIVLWTCSTHDWSTEDAKKVYACALNAAADGAIILFHDLYTSTAKAIELLVPQLIEQGYQLVTVSELLYFADETPKAGERFGGLVEQFKEDAAQD